jgi:hypothetical protein
MIDMTPFIDCARRLGRDPIDVFGPIAANGLARFQETFDLVVRRADLPLADSVGRWSTGGTDRPTDSSGLLHRWPARSRRWLAAA